jgi:hypothetical protein
MAIGAKAGIAIGVLIGVSVLGVVFFFFMRWRKRAMEREFEQIKEQHHRSGQSPEPRAVSLYPRASTTIVGGGATYRDIFDKPVYPR